MHTPSAPPLKAAICVGGKSGGYVSAVKRDEGAGSKDRQALVMYSRGGTYGILLLEGTYPSDENHCRSSSKGGQTREHLE